MLPQPDRPLRAQYILSCGSGLSSTLSDRNIDNRSAFAISISKTGCSNYPNSQEAEIARDSRVASAINLHSPIQVDHTFAVFARTQRPVYAIYGAYVYSRYIGAHIHSIFSHNVCVVFTQCNFVIFFLHLTFRCGKADSDRAMR